MCYTMPKYYASYVDIAISCIAYGRKASLIIISLSDWLIDNKKFFLKNVQWLETSTCRIVYIHELQIQYPSKSYAKNPIFCINDDNNWTIPDFPRRSELSLVRFVHYNQACRPWTIPSEPIDIFYRC